MYEIDLLLSLALFTFLIFSTELLMTLSSDILSKGNLPFSFPLYGLSLKEPPLMEALGQKHFLFLWRLLCCLIDCYCLLIISSCIFRLQTMLWSPVLENINILRDKGLLNKLRHHLWTVAKCWSICLRGNFAGISLIQFRKRYAAMQGTERAFGACAS